MEQSVAEFEQISRKALIDLKNLTHLELKSGELTTEQACQLFITHLCLGQLKEANFLWKRLPEAEQKKQDIVQLHDIAENLINRNIPPIYAMINAHSWPESLKSGIESLRVCIRYRCIDLVREAYSKVSLTFLATLLGQTEGEVKEVVQKLSWTIADEKAEKQFVLIRRDDTKRITELREKLSNVVDSSQIQKLTTIVSFLEI